jgi:hypothetical protein
VFALVLKGNPLQPVLQVRRDSRLPEASRIHWFTSGSGSPASRISRRSRVSGAESTPGAAAPAPPAPCGSHGFPGRRPTTSAISPRVHRGSGGPDAARRGVHPPSAAGSPPAATRSASGRIPARSSRSRRCGYDGTADEDDVPRSERRPVAPHSAPPGSRELHRTAEVDRGRRIQPGRKEKPQNAAAVVWLHAVRGSGTGSGAHTPTALVRAAQNAGVESRMHELWSEGL